MLFPTFLGASDDKRAAGDTRMLLAPHPPIC